MSIQLFATVVAAIWWFQPLCRVCYSRLRTESEHACDAIVLASGVKASDYAAELLEIARSFRPSPAEVAMARTGDLEDRVRSILYLSPTGAGSRALGFAIPALILLTLTASAVTIKEGNPMKRTLLSGLLASAGLSAATIGGSLLDSSGGAIPNAKASLYNPDTTVAQETATAADGKFSFTVPAGQYILRIQKPGFASLFREFNVQAESKVERGLTLTGADPKQIRIKGEMAQSNLIEKINPTYPVSAKQARLQGKVLLEAVISADGVPEDIRVVSSPGDDLTESALGAVRQWRYKPTLLNGEPIEVITDIVVNYTLAK